MSQPILQSSPPLIYQKMPRKEIYQKIDDVICRIVTSKGKASGFLIGKDLVCVPLHVVELQEIEKIDDKRSRFQVKAIHCIYQGIRYEAQWHTINLDTAINLDCAIFKISDNDFSSVPSLPLFTNDIEPGEKVYFGGFPLTQEHPTFHAGIVSSVPSKGEVSYFTIDGTVVPGNSGGPIFVVHENILKLAGIVTYQIADFSPEDQKTIAIMRTLKTQRQITPDNNTGGMSIGPHGFTSPVEIHTPQGRETVMVNDRDTICMALDLIQRNLSTGIGKALHVRHLKDVCDGRMVSIEGFASNAFPVMKGERLPGMLAQDLVYRDWYHRQVKGQSICAQIIGRQLSAADNITAEEERTLWKFYQANPPYNGFTPLNPEEDFKKLKSKIISATTKGLKNSKAIWAKRLQEIENQLPNLKIEFQNLYKILG